MPLILYATFAAQGLPIGTAFLVWGRRPPAPYTGLLVWCGVLVASATLEVWFGAVSSNNLWLTYFTLPTEAALVLLILSTWQPNEYLRLAYRLAIPAMVAAAVVVVLATDPAVTFDLWVSPFLCLLVLAAALHTMVHRSLLCRTPLAGEDWFWICLGLSVHWVGLVAVPAFHRAYIDSHVDWVRLAYFAKAWTNIAAFVLISWGVACTRIQARYSGRS